MDAYLKANNLSRAKAISQTILREKGVDEMLSEEEVEYLKLVIALERIIDTGRVSPEDLKNTD